MRYVGMLLLILAATTVAAHDEAWLLQANVSPNELLADGAIMTDIDTMQWADGTMISMTYWLAADEIVYRCATIVPGESPIPSCWRRELVAVGDTSIGLTTVRQISTRRRPIRHYTTPYGFSSRIWVGALSHQAWRETNVP